MDSELLSDTFVELADTMVAEFDVIDFLHLLTDRSVALLGASAAGVVLADPRGELRVAAASSEETMTPSGSPPVSVPASPSTWRSSAIASSSNSSGGATAP